MKLHLFEWPSRHSLHLALPLMLAVSFILHAFGVVVFDALYPPSRPSPERAAEIYFLPSHLPNAAKLFPYLEASDPALFSPEHVTLSPDDLPRISYVPTFDLPPPPLEPLPPAALPSFQPRAAKTGPVTIANRPPPAPSPKQGVSTAVRFSGGLKGRPFAAPSPFEFSPTPRQSLAPAVFDVAVSPEGRAVHVLPARSSGNETLDRAALRYLFQGRFEPASASATAWGVATFLWGADSERNQR